MATRTEEAAAKVMGAVKATKAAVEGLHGVFKRLAQEHGEVAALLERVKLSSSAEVRRNLFPEIRSRLLAHEKGERREVYPAFSRHPELERMAREHDGEAQRLERMLDQLIAADFEQESWKTLFDQLVELVEHHTEEEENDFFPAGEKVLGRDEAERLEVRYRAAEAELLREPS